LAFLRPTSATLLAALLFPGFSTGQHAVEAPKPIGKMVELGGHAIHVHCSGKGAPTVVIENGFEEYSFDWVLVQSEVEKFTRVCTYDRAGYAWSEQGPKPRTFAQINLELHEALTKLGERGPFVLVGHSFGGPVIRNYFLLYPKEVSGMVLAESVSEEQRVTIGKKAVRLRDDAKGKRIPEPHEMMLAADKPATSMGTEVSASSAVDPPFDRLPTEIQRFHLWADSQPALNDAENSEREWSPEYFASAIPAPRSHTEILTDSRVNSSDCAYSRQGWLRQRLGYSRGATGGGTIEDTSWIGDALYKRHSANRARWS